LQNNFYIETFVPLHTALANNCSLTTLEYDFLISVVRWAGLYKPTIMHRLSGGESPEFYEALRFNVALIILRFAVSTKKNFATLTLRTDVRFFLSYEVDTSSYHVFIRRNRLFSSFSPSLLALIMCAKWQRWGLSVEVWETVLFAFILVQLECNVGAAGSRMMNRFTPSPPYFNTFDDGYQGAMPAYFPTPVTDYPTTPTYYLTSPSYTPTSP
jgi:hypothetical protein